MLTILQISDLQELGTGHGIGKTEHLCSQMLQLGCLNAGRFLGWFVGTIYPGHWFQQSMFPWFSSMPCLLELECPGACSLSCLAPGLGWLHELRLGSHHSVSPCSASV